MRFWLLGLALLALSSPAQAQSPTPTQQLQSVINQLQLDNAQLTKEIDAEVTVFGVPPVRYTMLDPSNNPVNANLNIPKTSWFSANLIVVLNFKVAVTLSVDNPPFTQTYPPGMTYVIVPPPTGGVLVQNYTITGNGITLYQVANTSFRVLNDQTLGFYLYTNWP
jgi:hypothetical protein